MSDEPMLTIRGNLTADPELRYTPSGAASATFTVAETPRYFDRQASDWKDGETLFMRCQAWRDLAENISRSFTKGDRVIVEGRLTQRSYEAHGERRTVIELQVEDAGLSVRFATATAQRRYREPTDEDAVADLGLEQSAEPDRAHPVPTEQSPEESEAARRQRLQQASFPEPATAAVTHPPQASSLDRPERPTQGASEPGRGRDNGRS